MVQVWRRRDLAVLLLGSGLTGCGFHPVYAPTAHGGVATDLGAIEVPILGGRTGQVFRQALIERLERGGGGGAKRYDLVVSYSINSESVAVQKDSAVSRVRLTAIAVWSLVSQDAQRRTIASGTSRSTDGYDPIDIQYFESEMNAEEVQRRLANQVAEQVVLRLALALNRLGVSATGAG